MIKFKDFLNENAVLHSFDVDDTLFHTNAKIHVKDKHGNTVKTLTNQEFNDHKLEPGHHYDFHEFRSAEKFHKESKPMPTMIDQLNRVHKKIKLGLSPGSKIIMNTAREDFDDKNKFLDTFRKHGMSIDDIHVHRAGNEPGEDPPAKKKLAVLRRHLDTGKYKEVHCYDDSKTNLKHFKELNKEYPHIKFHAWHVHHDGTIHNF